MSIQTNSTSTCRYCGLAIQYQQSLITGGHRWFHIPTVKNRIASTWCPKSFTTKAEPQGPIWGPHQDNLLQEVLNGISRKL